MPNRKLSVWRFRFVLLVSIGIAACDNDSIETYITSPKQNARLSLPFVYTQSKLAESTDVEIEYRVAGVGSDNALLSIIVLVNGEEFARHWGPSPIVIDNLPAGHYEVTLLPTLGEKLFDSTASVDFDVLDFSYSMANAWGTYGTDPGKYQQPYGAIVDPDQTFLYITDCTKGTIVKTTLEGKFVAEIGDGFGVAPGQLRYDSDIDIDSQGNLWIVEERNHRVTKLSPDGRYLGSWGSLGSGPGEFDNPLGIALDSEDNVYVVDNLNFRVQKFDPSMAYLGEWGSFGVGDREFLGPYYIAIDDNDDIYVVDRAADVVKKYDANGTFLLSWGGSGSNEGQFDYPHEIAIDKYGFVYVVDTYNHRFQVFSPDGQFVSQHGNAAVFSVPKAIAVDEQLNVYIADLGAAAGFVTRWTRNAVVPSNILVSSDFAPKLSDYQLYLSPPNFTAVNNAAVNYIPEWELWKNGALKERFIVLPNGSQIDVSNRSVWSFPEGTLFFKTFFEVDHTMPLGRRAIETRILKRDAENWVYAAYLWDDRNSDANLVSGRTPTVVQSVQDGVQYEYQIPSTSQCISCHESASSSVLGFRENQLNLPFEENPALQTSYIELFESLGYFNAVLPVPRDKIADPFRDVKGYLQGNCVHCHNGDRAVDLSDEALLLNTVNVPAGSTFGPGTLVTPGQPDASLLLSLVEEQIMPPIGVELPDPNGIGMIRNWINEL